MSFFPIHVVTGKEILTKEMLRKTLNMKQVKGVKGIYAMESYDATTDSNNPDAIETEDIVNHLHVQRLQFGLSNLRFAYENLKERNDEKSCDLLHDYKKNIRSLTKQLNQIRNHTRKIQCVFPGYILIELDEDFHYLPDYLYHLIKSVPGVISSSLNNSRMKILDDEVDGFFKTIELTKEVEVQLDEALSYKEEKQKENNLLYQLNQNVSNEKEQELIEDLDNLDVNVEQEVRDMKEKSDTIIQRIKTFIKNKRKTVTMPTTLFVNIYQDVKGILPAKKLSSDFINRLQRWIQKHEVGWQ